MTTQLLGSLVFVAVGLGVVLACVVAGYYAVRSKEWPAETGEIVTSRVVEAHDTEGGHLYRAEISYRYSVSGRQYIGKRPRFGYWIWLGWRRPAERLRRRYYVGAQVPVRYDPGNPSESVLEPGISALLVFELLFGITFFIIGFLSAQAV